MHFLGLNLVAAHSLATWNPNVKRLEVDVVKYIESRTALASTALAQAPTSSPLPLSAKSVVANTAAGSVAYHSALPMLSATNIGSGASAAAAVPSMVTRVDSPTDYNEQELLLFYRGKLANIHGETLISMQGYPFSKKEMEHMYIQWMWPTKKPSEQQPMAMGPVLSDKFIEILKNDNTAVDMAKESLKVMLAFYGLQKNENGTITKANTFAEREREWCPGGYDHNHARLTRMIESLQYFGLVAESKALYLCLLSLAQEKPSRFAYGTVDYWAAAAPK